MFRKGIDVARELLQAEAQDEAIAFEEPVKVYGEELHTWDDLHELQEEEDGYFDAQLHGARDWYYVGRRCLRSGMKCGTLSLTEFLRY